MQAPHARHGYLPDRAAVLLLLAACLLSRAAALPAAEGNYFAPGPPSRYQAPSAEPPRPLTGESSRSAVPLSEAAPAEGAANGQPPSASAWEPAPPAGGPTQPNDPSGLPHEVEPATFQLLPNESDLPRQRAAGDGRSDQPRPLKPPGSGRTLPRSANQADGESPAPSVLPSLWTVSGSLLLVLAAFFGLAWLMRRGMPNKLAPLPQEAVEVLGRSTLASRNQMHLIRVGGKLILVSVTPAGAETLTEITEPGEVERLAGICSRSAPQSISNTFRSVLHQVGRETGSDPDDPPQVAAGGARRHPGLLASLFSGGGRHV